MGREDNCRPKISDNCGTKVSMNCVEYYGKLPNGSKYKDGDCISGSDIVEDIIDILDGYGDALDFSDFKGAGCIEYTKDGEELTIKDVIKGLDAKICDISETCCKSEENNDCGCDNGCHDDGCKCGLVYYSSWIGDSSLNDVYRDISNGSISYKATETATYKITVESYYQPNYNIKLGVSLDGNMPNGGVFDETRNVGASSPHTTTFIKDISKGVNIGIMYMNGNTDPDIHNVIFTYKVIIEKVK